MTRSSGVQPLKSKRMSERRPSLKKITRSIPTMSNSDVVATPIVSYFRLDVLTAVLLEDGTGETSLWIRVR